MSEWIKKNILRRESEEKTDLPIVASTAVKLDIVDTMHQTMALTISNIAKEYPKNFDMVKQILTEYAFLIEHALRYRDTGDPVELFKKLMEFVIRSVEGYLDKYENDEIVKEELPVKDLIMEGLIQIEEAIILKEGIQLPISDPSKLSPKKPAEDWSKTRMIKKRGGLPSLDTPIENVKGIGTETAKELKALGVDTLEKYVDYQKAHQSENNEDVDEHE